MGCEIPRSVTPGGSCCGGACRPLLPGSLTWVAEPGASPCWWPSSVTSLTGSTSPRRCCASPRPKPSASGMSASITVTPVRHPCRLAGMKSCSAGMFYGPSKIRRLRSGPGRSSLAAQGRLVVIEGQWSTGAGLAAADVVRLLGDAGFPASRTEDLDDPLSWGWTDQRPALHRHGGSRPMSCSAPESHGHADPAPR
jgi:hypothetical protein